MQQLLISPSNPLESPRKDFHLNEHVNIVETASSVPNSTKSSVQQRLTEACLRLQSRGSMQKQKVALARSLFDQAIVKHLSSKRPPIVISSYRQLQWSAIAAGCFEQLLSETTFRRSIAKDKQCKIAGTRRVARAYGRLEISRFLDAALESLPHGDIRIRPNFRWPPALKASEPAGSISHNGQPLERSSQLTNGVNRDD